MTSRERAMTALAAANEVRAARARVKREIERAAKGTARRRVAEVLLVPGDEWRSASVSELLRCVRGFGPGKIGSVCGRVGVDPSRRLDSLSGRQRLAFAVLLCPDVSVGVVLGEAA